MRASSATFGGVEPIPPSPEPLRILHLTAPGAAGGLESVVLGLTAGLRRRGHEVWLGCTVLPGLGPPPLAVMAGQAGVRVLTLPIGRRAYRTEIRTVAGLLQSERIGVLHSHGYRSDVVGALAARRAKVPQVTTAHGFIGGSRRGRMYEWLQLQVARRAAAAVAVSRPIAARYAGAGVPAARIHLIPNAWSGENPFGRSEARAVLGLRPGVPLVGWVGRLSREKGPDLFVDALALMPDVPWEAAIVGEGPERRELASRAAALGIADRIRWPGLVPEMGRVMGALDAFVLSSRTEGTPIALLEAMAAGVPTVATAVGGVPDMLSEGEAWLIAPESPGALAEALRSLLADREAAARRGEAARERLLRERSDGPWLARHEALYRSVIGGDPAT